ncbi:MAG: hypothetical protein M1818_002417 [Claussenomyces sp. TS43310]|nr:MAG: hypothetical protein M1818_002417 [Claussenomyces sp. TS43310]
MANHERNPLTAHQEFIANVLLPSVQAGSVITKLEDMFESMVDCLIGEKTGLTIHLRSRGRSQQRAFDSEGAVIDTPNFQVREITFPGKTAAEAWKFTALLRILELSHEALVTGTVMTKRDIYYRDPELFMTQAVVDRYVDDLAFTLGVERDALNVVAAAKGLVAGALLITKRCGGVIDCTAESSGLLIPHVKEIRTCDFSGVQWVLVIEKEATFRTLSFTRYWKNSTSGNGILVTAKGYPDIQTRAFLKAVSTENPYLLIYGLFDFDPDGIGILSTYKHGSSALAHENRNLVIKNMRWLGVRSSDLLKDMASSDEQGLLKLTPRDRRIATLMLQKGVLQEHVEPEWRRELQVMLMLNIKAEIQVMSNRRSLEDYLDIQLRSR